MSFNNISSVYFLGIGGIGMSALARYFHAIGKPVAGYDRTPTPLTDLLEKEGIRIHFQDDPTLIPEDMKDPHTTLVVYTPAIPSSNKELGFLREQGYQLKKRAEVLGLITANKRGICIAGTHGKTTVTTMVAHLLKQSHVNCNAFLGGISKNYGKNLLLAKGNDNVVVEADEFDRSFLQLHPYHAVVTSVDADHLDIYGNRKAITESFETFTRLINPGGALVMKKGLDFLPALKDQVKQYSYALNEEGDFYGIIKGVENNLYTFDFFTPEGEIPNLTLGIPGKINVENAIAACAIAWLNGVSSDELRKALPKFKGISRRFDIQFSSREVIFIDDYAHHPAELKATITSVRDLFPKHRVVGIFQPHLFTRTRDFSGEFAQSLDLLDVARLLDIYPARELPIPEITSEIILEQMTLENKKIISKEEVTNTIPIEGPTVILTMGAGNIDRLVPQITHWLESRTK